MILIVVLTVEDTVKLIGNKSIPLDLQVHNQSSYSIKSYRSHEEGVCRKKLESVLMLCA